MKKIAASLTTGKSRIHLGERERERGGEILKIGVYVIAVERRRLGSKIALNIETYRGP